MCNPQAFIAVAQGIMQQNAAVAQANRQNALYRQNAANATVALSDDYRAINRRVDQEGQAAAKDKFDILLESLRQSGKAQTAAGEAGVAGNSVSRLLADITRQTTVAQNTVQRNFDWTKAQSEDSKAGAKATFNSRVNSVSKGYAPSAMDAMLGIGLNAGAAYLGDPNGENWSKAKENTSKYFSNLKPRGN